MNYQPFSHDFVVENPDQQTFFVNREVFVSEDVLEREKRRILDRCWVYVGHGSELKNPGDFKTRPWPGGRSSSAATARARSMRSSIAAGIAARWCAASAKATLGSSTACITAGPIIRMAG